MCNTEPVEPTAKTNANKVAELLLELTLDGTQIVSWVEFVSASSEKLELSGAELAEALNILENTQQVYVERNGISLFVNCFNEHSR